MVKFLGVIVMENKLGTYETQLTIQQEVYDMLIYAYPLLDNFPKSQKFSLVQDIKKSMDEVLKYAIMANKKYVKTTTLEKMDVELAALKIYVRLAFDLHYFKGANNYMEFSRRLNEIGNMLGGWLKAEKAKSGNTAVEKTYVCAECGTKITAKSYEYSMRVFGKALCYACQKQNRD